MFLGSYGCLFGCTRTGRAPTPADMSYLHSVSLCLKTKWHLLGKEIMKSSALQYNFRSDCVVYPLPEAGQTVCRPQRLHAGACLLPGERARADEAGLQSLASAWPMQANSHPERRGLLSPVSALLGELIDQIENTHAPAIMRPCADEVIAPHVVLPLRPNPHARARR
jgi:hypothetical protein